MMVDAGTNWEAQTSAANDRARIIRPHACRSRTGRVCAQHPSVRLDLRLSDEALDVVEGADDLVASNGAIRPLD